MIRNFLFYFLFIAFIGFLTGCNNQDDSLPVDTTPPAIDNVLLNEMSPGDEIVVAPGSEIDLEATFTDDRELGQYRIEIHDDFDNHGHERLKSEIFGFDQIYNLSGSTQSIHEHIPIPANATPGPYHFTLSFFDAAGNEGQDVVIDFIIADPESQPAINIISPDFENEIEAVPGQAITLEGTITDPDGLEEVHITLVHEDHGHEHGRTNDEPIYDMEYELDGITTFNFDDSEPISIPENTPAGHYLLKITAKDLLGNLASITAEVHID